MKTKAKKRTVKEGRPSASKQEVMTALTRGMLTGLLQEKRVSLGVAEDVLVETRAFLSGDGTTIADTDPRLVPIIRHIEHERKRVTNARDTHGSDARRIGQTVRYKAQKNKQRKQKYVHTPLSTLEADGKGRLDWVDISFASDAKGPFIIVRRSAKQ